MQRLPEPKYGATAISKNSKVGPTLVTSTSMDSCWEGCPHHAVNNGSCYALFGPQGLYWRKLGKSIGMSFMQLFYYLRRHIPRHTVWRHNVSGDLPSRHDNKVIDARFIKILTTLNKQCQGKGFTYTHKPWRENLFTLYYANENGFTINVSTDSLDDAVEAYSSSLPTTITVSNDIKSNDFVYKSVRFVTCPEQTGKMRNCVECKLCYKADRKFIIMFRAHGPKARHIITGATT